MTVGDVVTQIVNSDATSVDTALTALRTTMGVSGAYMMTSIGPMNEQILLVAIQNIV